MVAAAALAGGFAAGATAGNPAVVNPLQQRDWDALVAVHPGASFFHSAGWVRVLAETYGHQPEYLCRFEGVRLEQVLPLMEVTSRWTGRRGVSLPFTDFCQAVGAGPDNGAGLYPSAMRLGRERRWRYLECRGHAGGWAGSSPSLRFYGHVVDLDRPLDAVFKGLDGSVRQAIRKAEGAALKAEFGTSVDAMQIFYGLHCRTRRRHGLPPQPWRFFESITRNVLEQDRGFITTVLVADRPVAAAVFFYFGRQAIFKFGASDHRFQHLRPNNLAMWEGMKHCAELGATTLHLGRTSMDNEGLRRFKLGFGADEETIEYLKYDFRREAFVSDHDSVKGWFNHFFSCFPLPLLRFAGRILYPHLS